MSVIELWTYVAKLTMTAKAIKQMKYLKEVHTIEQHVQVYSKLESIVKVVKKKESNCKWQRCPGTVGG